MDCPGSGKTLLLKHLAQLKQASRVSILISRGNGTKVDVSSWLHCQFAPIYVWVETSLPTRLEQPFPCHYPRAQHFGPCGLIVAA